MSSNPKHLITLSLRLPPKLRRDLATIAERESNTTGAVARRLLTRAVRVELEAEPPSAPSRALVLERTEGPTTT